MCNYKEAEELNKRGIKAFNKGELADALRLLSKAISMCSDAEYYSNKAIVNRASNNLDEALIDIDTAISIDPNNYLYYKNKAAILKSQELYSKALIELNKSLDLVNHDSELYSDRSLVLSKLKKYRQALSDIDTAISLEDNSEYQLFKAILLYKLNENFQAKMIFETLIRVPKYSNKAKYYLKLLRISSS